MKKAKIILTTECDLTENYKKIIEEDEEVGYFRSIVVVAREDFDGVKQFMAEDPDLPGISSIDDVKSDHERLIDDFVNFGGFDRDQVTKILKGFENETMSKKISLISDFCKKEAEKKAKEEEKKKKEEEKKKKEEKKSAPKEELKEEMKEESSTPSDSVETNEMTKEPSTSESIVLEEKSKEELLKESKEESKEELKEVKIDDDPDTIFGLIEEDKLISNFATLGTQETQNYYNHEPPKIKKNLGDLFSKVYTI